MSMKPMSIVIKKTKSETLYKKMLGRGGFECSVSSRESQRKLNILMDKPRDLPKARSGRILF